MTIPCERFTSQRPDAPDADIYLCVTCIAERRGYHTKLSHDIAAAVRVDERQQWATEKAALEAELATFYEAYRRSCDVESKEALAQADTGKGSSGICIHGGLRRRCETCDLADRLEAAERGGRGDE